MKKIIALIFLFAASALLVACGSPEEPRTWTVAEKEQALTEAFVAYMGTQEGKATIAARGGILSTSLQDPSWASIANDHPVVKENNSNITIKFGGSTSVQAIAEALSAQFAPLAGNFVPQHVHTGSGDAVKRTLGSDKDTANSIHIGFSSRDWNQTENDLFATVNETKGQLAWDAVVAIVHPSNTATNATAAALKAIYEAASASAITKWGNFPAGQGEGADIKPYTRDTASGTRGAFFAIIGFAAAETDNAPLVSSVIQVESNGAVLTSVAGDVNGIGYVSLASIVGKTDIKPLTFAGIVASEANVLNNTYLLKRPFLFVTRYSA